MTQLGWAQDTSLKAPVLVENKTPPLVLLSALVKSSLSGLPSQVWWMVLVPSLSKQYLIKP